MVIKNLLPATRRKQLSHSRVGAPGAGDGGASGTSGDSTFQKASPCGCTGALQSMWVPRGWPPPPAPGCTGGEAAPVTGSRCSPDSLQPSRVCAQRHAEAAAEPDAAVRGGQPASARVPPAVPGPGLIPLPHPGGNQTGDHGTLRFPGERAGASAHGGDSAQLRAAGTLWTQPPTFPAQGACL